MIDAATDSFSAPLFAYTTEQDRMAVYAAAKAEQISVSSWLRRTVHEALAERSAA